MGPEEREELFERAKNLAANPKTAGEADRLWLTVITAYKLAIEAADVIDRSDERHLARALWGHSSLLSRLGRTDDAVTAGREAVAVFGRINDAVTPEHPDPNAPLRDRALGELLAAKADLARYECAADRSSLLIDLLRQTAVIGINQVRDPVSAGPWTKTAMAFVYQHLAVALLDRHLDSDDIIEATLMSMLAVEIRLADLERSTPQGRMDLAATYVVYARCLMARGDHTQLSMVVPLAESLMEFIGAPAADLRAQLRSVVGLSEIPPLPDSLALRMDYGTPPRRRWWRRSR